MNLHDGPTRDVLEDHLFLRQKGDFETDLSRNLSDDVVLLTREGESHGHDGARESGWSPVQVRTPLTSMA